MAALPFLNVGRRPVETDPSGRYKRYDTIIGEGAMKKVYLGLDGVEGKEVAWSKTELTKEILKDKKLLENLCTEAELMKVLRHDNIVTCFKSWIDYEHNFINPSGNLGDYVRRYNPVIRIVIKNWCKQILRGLDYLHRNNIIHRDLNTDNIFIYGSLSTAKIGDLGLALVFQHGANVKKVSCRSEFMAPELLDVDEGYSQLIDIYALGMCVLQMVSRETPYSECVNKYHICGKIKAGVMPEALSRVQDKEIKDFIMKCLSSAPARPNASDLLRDSFFGPNDSATEAGSSSQRPQSRSEPEDKKQKGPAEVLEPNDSNTEAGSSSQSKSESEDTKQKGAAEILESNDPNTEAGSSSQSKSESEDTKQEETAEIPESNDPNTEAGSSSHSKSESEDTKQKGAAEIPESEDSNTEAGGSSQVRSESEDQKQKGPAEILPSNNSNTEAGSSSQSTSEPGFLKDTFNEMVGEQPISLRVRVQPRSFRLRSRSLAHGTFKIRLYFNNAGYEFDFSVETILRTNFKEHPVLSQLLSEMTTTEFALMSSLLIEMVTSPVSENGRIKLLEVTSEERKVRPVFQPNTTPKPPVPDTMQQP